MNQTDWLQIIMFAAALVSISVAIWFLREAWRKLRDPDPWQRMRWPLAAALAFPNAMLGAVLIGTAIAAPWQF